jgi:hypothetical protein
MERLILFDSAFSYFTINLQSEYTQVTLMLTV